MSEVTQLPGGPQVPTPQASGDGATITQLGTYGPVLTTVIHSNQNEALNAIVATAALPFGTPVFANPATTPAKWDKAYADSEVKSCVAGLLAKAAVQGGECAIQDRGFLTGTVAQWNAVCQGATTGLVPGVQYYLNSNEAQKPLTPNPQTNEADANVLLGYAITPTTLKIQISFLTSLVS